MFGWKIIPILSKIKYIENFGLMMYLWGKNTQKQLDNLHQLECMQKSRSYSLHVVRGVHSENFEIKLNQVSKFRPDEIS